MPTMKQRKERASKLASIKEDLASGVIPEIKPLTNISDLNSIRPTAHKPSEFEGQDLILYSYEFNIGNFGDYYTMSIARMSEPTELNDVTSGGQTIKAQLEKLDTLAVELPLAIRFGHTGNQAYIIFQ